MTIAYKEDHTNKTVELTVDGKITQDDFNRVAGQFETFIEKHGKVKMLEIIKDFKGFEPSVIWSGIKFDMKHLKDISHCAVISDKGWIGSFTKAASGLVSCEIKTFTTDKIEDARKWLKNVDEQKL